jgi:hypothetical protein
MARRVRRPGRPPDRLEFPSDLQLRREGDVGDAETALVARDIRDLKDRLEKLESSIESLVKAWEAAGTLVTFVKWAAGLGTALGVAWTALHQFIGKP